MKNHIALRYSLLASSLAFGALPLYVFVPNFYNSINQQTFIGIGLVIAIARMTEAIIDPFFGLLSDVIPKKQLIGLALIPYIIGYIAVFNPSSFIDPYLWLFFSLFFCLAGFSCAGIAYASLATEIVEDRLSLYKISAVREFFGVFGLILAALLPSLTLESYAFDLQTTGYVLAIISSIAWLALLTIKSKNENVMHTSILKNMIVIKRDTRFLIIMLIYIISGLASAIPITLFVFFVDNIVQEKQYMGFFLVTYIISSAFGIPLWMKLAAQINIFNAWLISMIIAIIGFTLNYLVEAHNFKLFIIISIITGFANGADLSLPVTIVSEIGKEKKRSGLFLGVSTMVGKICFALGSAFALIPLGLFQFNPQTIETLPILFHTYITLPLIFKTVACVLLLFLRGRLLAVNNQH